MVAYRKLLDLDPKYLTWSLTCSAIYTSALAVIAMGVFSMSVQAPASTLYCNGFSPIYSSTDTDGVITYFNSSIDGSSLSYICDNASTAGVQKWLLCMALSIFLVYLFHKANQLEFARLISSALKEGTEKEIRLMKFVDALNVLNGVQLVLVEICGLGLLATATNSVDLIVNSAGTIFLAEVDDLLLDMILTSAIRKARVPVTVELFGLEFDLSVKTVEETDDKDPEKKMTSKKVYYLEDLSETPAKPAHV